MNMNLQVDTGITLILHGISRPSCFSSPIAVSRSLNCRVLASSRLPGERRRFKSRVHHFVFFVTFDFQVNYSFCIFVVGRLDQPNYIFSFFSLVGLGFIIRVRVRVRVTVRISVRGSVLGLVLWFRVSFYVYSLANKAWAAHAA